MLKRRINRITVCSPKLTAPLRLAVVTDLHDAEYQEALPHMQGVDAILIVGDLVVRYSDGFDNAIRFLYDAAGIAPTFYSIGNHERRLPSKDAWRKAVEASPATLLDNRYVRFGEIVLGGLSSALEADRSDELPRRMEKEPGFKLLMCHHPEFFEPLIKPYDIDLTLAGHAHGGQVQIFGRGMYSPGQGLFPRLTHGFYFDRRLLVSRGMTSPNRLPRWGNPCEMILLELLPDA